MLTPPACTIFFASPLLGKIFVSARKEIISTPKFCLANSTFGTPSITCNNSSSLSCFKISAVSLLNNICEACTAKSYSFFEWTNVVTSSASFCCNIRKCSFPLCCAFNSFIFSSVKKVNVFKYLSASSSAALSQNW